MSGIEVNNLVKSFGSNRALDDISLQLKENTIYGLLGRNGAGKSTLLNILSNRIFADSGEALLDGKSVVENDEVQNKLFLMSERTFYPEKMKISNVFKWSKQFYPNFDEEYAKDLAEQFELKLLEKVSSLSTGYTTIFKLIIALSVNTPYILLDEPVLGLDANHRELFYRILINKYSEKPCTIVISTHLIEEISGLIENIIILKQGKIIKNESCEELLSKGYTITGAISLVDQFILDKEVIGMDVIGGLKSAYVIGEIKNEVPQGIEITRMDLQKLFIQLTNA
ncbi:MAG: ATP-binding cassette domain-containing protein [Lachnotalea sp.]